MLLSQHKIRRYFPLCKSPEKRSWKCEHISRDRPCFTIIQIGLLRLKKAVFMNIDMTDDHWPVCHKHPGLWGRNGAAGRRRELGAGRGAPPARAAARSGAEAAPRGGAGRRRSPASSCAGLSPGACPGHSHCRGWLPGIWNNNTDIKNWWTWFSRPRKHFLNCIDTDLLLIQLLLCKLLHESDIVFTDFCGKLWLPTQMNDAADILVFKQTVTAESLDRKNRRGERESLQSGVRHQGRF